MNFPCHKMNSKKIYSKCYIKFIQNGLIVILELFIALFQFVTAFHTNLLN